MGKLPSGLYPENFVYPGDEVPEGDTVVVDEMPDFFFHNFQCTNVYTISLHNLLLDILDIKIFLEFWFNNYIIF